MKSLGLVVSLALCTALLTYSVLRLVPSTDPAPATTKIKATPPPPPYQLPQDYTHVVFIGDSLTRYQYLDFVYRVHFGVSEVPDVVTCERFHESWNDFFEKSTAVFEGSMSCDCYRDNALTLNFENRYYKHPKLNLTLSFFLNIGDFTPMSFFLSPQHLPLAKPLKIRPNFHRRSLLEAVDYLNNLTPKPTHIILNFGLWPHSGPMKDLHPFFLRARAITPFIVWKGTSPGRAEAPPSPDTTWINNFLYRRVTSPGGDATSFPLCLKGLCTFFPFPVGTICSESYWDTYHFYPATYNHWNGALYSLIGQTYKDARTVAGANFADAEKLFNKSAIPCQAGRVPQSHNVATPGFHGPSVDPPQGMSYMPTADPKQHIVTFVGDAEVKAIFKTFALNFLARDDGKEDSRHPCVDLKKTSIISKVTHRQIFVELPSLGKTVALSGYKCRTTQGTEALLSYIPMNEAVDFKYAVVPALREMDPPASTVVLHKAPFMKCDSKLEELIGTVYEWTTIRAPHGSVLWLQSIGLDNCDNVTTALKESKVIGTFTHTEVKDVIWRSVLGN